MAINKHIDRCLRRPTSTKQPNSDNDDSEDSEYIAASASDDDDSNEEWDGEADITTRRKSGRRRSASRSTDVAGTSTIRTRRSLTNTPASEEEPTSKRQKTSRKSDTVKFSRGLQSKVTNQTDDDWNNRHFEERVITTAKDIFADSISSASSSDLASSEDCETIDDVDFNASTIKTILAVTKTEFGTYVDSRTWDQLFGYQKDGLKWFQKLYSDGLGGILVRIYSIYTDIEHVAFLIPVVIYVRAMKWV